VRLVGNNEVRGWNGRGHFFAAAATAMRRILIERARQKRRQIHGGGRQRLELHPDILASREPDEDLLALDSALAKLAERDPVKARLVATGGRVGTSQSRAAPSQGLCRCRADRPQVPGNPREAPAGPLEHG
jgi:hypothetical protein